MAESDKDKEPLEDSIYSDATHDRFNAVEAAALAGRPFPEFEDEVAAEELEDLREFYALAIEATRSPTEEKETADQPVDDFAELKRLFEETTRYELLGYIGHGGFGWVYQGQSALGRRVAIKVLGPDFKKCIQEGQAAARVDSDFIVTIHEYGELPNGRMFLVMDLVQGESEDASLLGYIGPETPPPPEETILRWMKEVSEGMAAAAALGITHRDLKPANILIDINRDKDKGGRARIGDFGLARIENDETPAAESPGEVAGDTDSAESPTGDPVGHHAGSDAIYKSQTAGNHGYTPEYCSPEQVKDPRTATQQSDIYCFGATFYHLASGKLPMGDRRGEEVEDLKKENVENIPAPEELTKLNPGLSEEICSLIMDCLKNEPSERPESFTKILTRLPESDPGLTPEKIAKVTEDVKKLGPDGLGPEMMEKLAELNSISSGWKEERSIEKRRIEKHLTDLSSKRNESIGEEIDPADLPLLYPAEIPPFDEPEEEETDGFTRDEEVGDPSAEDAEAGGEETLALADLEALIKQGDIFLRSERASDYEEAILLYDQAISLDPENRDAWGQRHQAYHQLGKFDRVIEVYTETLERSPENAKAWHYRGRAYYEKGEYEQAINDHTKAIGLGEENSVAWCWRGLAYSAADDPDKAIVDFEQALRRDPEDIWTTYHLGFEYGYTGQLDQAIKHFDTTIQLAPEHDLALFWRGRAYSEKGDFDRAIEDFDEAIRIEPKDADFRYYRGRAYFDKAEFDKAIENYDEAIRINPKYDEAWWRRGLAHEAMDEKNLALEDLNKAVQLDSESAFYRSQRGFVYCQKREFDKAIEDLNIAIQRDPEKAYYRYQLADAYHAKEEFDKAIENFDEAIKLNPKDANFRYYRGRAYFDKGESDKAIEDFDEAIRLDQKYDRAWHYRGMAYARKGEVDKAI